MLDYSHYTKDKTYTDMVTTALLANVGPTFDYMVPAHFGDEGNDDLAFWGFAVLAAAERNYVQPSTKIPSWLQLGENIFNTLINRWNTTACGGGVAWQIFATNPNGMDYKNSVSNGGLFQIAARLARATNNQTYADWANKVWDWSVAVNFVDKDLNVYDGASSADNCTKTNYLAFSYTQGIYLYGAAVLANYTEDKVWADRAAGLLAAAQHGYFSPFSNATDVMWEHACEGVNTCTTDMKSFKGYLSRFMYASAQMQPALKDKVVTLLHASAAAAANACTGGTKGTTCGQKWYVGGFDGSVGLGQQMCALETIQGLLFESAAPPLRAGQIKDLKVPEPEPTPTPSETHAPSPTASKKNAAVSTPAADLRWLGLSALVGVLMMGGFLVGL